MKIDFSKVIFMDKSHDIWWAWWTLSNSDMPATKRKQQGSSSMMIWAGIVNKTIIGWFKVNERVKLNNANYCDFMDKTFFARYKFQSWSFKVKCKEKLKNKVIQSKEFIVKES